MSNINSNLLNGGFLFQHEQLYYFQFANSIICFDNGSKEKKDVISGQSKYSNLFRKDDYLYFVSDAGLMRYDFLKRSTERLVYSSGSDSILCMQCDDDWIYYTQHHGIKHGEFYKIRYDGSQKTMLLPYDIYSVYVSDGWIYFTDPKHNGIFRMTTEGTRTTQISDYESCFLNVCNGWMYFSNIADGRKAYKIRIDGSDEYKLNDDASWHLNLHNHWLYYQRQDSSTDMLRMLVYKVFSGEIYDSDQQIMFIDGRPTESSILEYYKNPHQVSNTQVTRFIVSSLSIFGMTPDNQLIEIPHYVIGNDDGKIFEFPFPRLHVVV